LVGSFKKSKTCYSLLGLIKMEMQKLKKEFEDLKKRFKFFYTCEKCGSIYGSDYKDDSWLCALCESK